MALRLAVLSGFVWVESASAGAVPEAVRLAKDLLETPENRLNIGNASLQLSRLAVSNVDAARGADTLDAIAGRVARIVGGSPDPDFRIRAINTVLYRELGFGYDPQAIRLGNGNPDVQTLWHLLETRRGNCVSLPVLWYAIAERLRYPVYAVSAPQHIFLRYDDGKYRSNIEATSGGGGPTDEEIVRDLQIPEQGVRSGAYLRSLSKREFLAVLVGDAAGPFLKTREFGVAIPMLELALNFDAVSVETQMQLAFAWQMSARGPRSADARERALGYARTATALGAAEPLKEGYWDDFVNGKLGEKSRVSLKPKPFDVVTWIQAVGRAEDAATFGVTILHRPHRSIGMSVREPMLEVAPAPARLPEREQSAFNLNRCKTETVAEEGQSGPGTALVPSDSRCARISPEAPWNSSPLDPEQLQ